MLDLSQQPRSARFRISRNISCGNLWRQQAAAELTGAQRGEPFRKRSPTTNWEKRTGRACLPCFRGKSSQSALIKSNLCFLPSQAFAARRGTLHECTAVDVDLLVPVMKAPSATKKSTALPISSA
jgi:hypothetical protein